MIDDFFKGHYGVLTIFGVIIFFTLVTVVFYYRKDKYDPEPLSRIFLAFGYGLLSVIPALIFSLIAGVIVVSFTNIGNPVLLSIVLSVLVAPPVEETTKGWFVIRLSKSDEFDGPLDGLIYGAMVGAGFAAAENVLYGFSAFAADGGIFAGVFIATVRSLTQIIGHPFYTGLFGVGVGEAKVGLTNDKYNRLLQAILLHALWNTAASLGGYLVLGGLGIMIAISIYLLRKELRRAIELDRDAYERGYYDQKKKFLEEKRRRIQEQIRRGPQAWQPQPRPPWQNEQSRQWPQHPEQQPQVWHRQAQQGPDQWQQQPQNIPPWGRQGPRQDEGQTAHDQAPTWQSPEETEPTDPSRSLWSEEQKKKKTDDDKDEF